MIAAAVENISDQFVAKWSQTVSHVPSLMLDGTWPSLGVLDLLTFPLRGQVQLSVVDKRLVKVCAAYLSIMAHECWCKFGVTVIVDEDEKGMYIRAMDPQVPTASREFRVNIEAELRRCLMQPPLPFPVLADFSRNVSPEQNIISLFALGLVTGLTPFGDGYWLNETVDTFAENINKAVTILAHTSAEHYGRIFPKEQLGQVGELYLHQLIYPPILMKEELPASTAVSGMVDFFAEYQVKLGAIQQLSHNLALVSDDQIAQAGLAMYAAVCEEIPPPEIIAAAESRGSFLGVLRSAMLDARDQFGLKSEWLHEGEFSAEDMKRFDIEMALGMLPWIKLSKEKIKEKKRNQKLVPLLSALAAFDMRESVKACDEILTETPGDLEVRIQRVFLDFLNAEFDKASVEFRKLLSEPGAETDSTFFNLWGLTELSRNNIAEAERHFANAYSNVRSSDLFQLYQIANNYAWALILLEDYDKAVQILDHAIEKAPCPVTAMLNKAYILRTTGRLAEAAEIQNKLLQIYPLDRRVFGNLLASTVVAKS